MDEKNTPQEFEQLHSEDISKQLEDVTNAQEKRKKYVRTFAKDVAEQMKSNSASVVKVALAEQNRQREYETIVKNTKKQQVIFLVLTFVCFVGGAIALAFAFSSKVEPVPLVTPIQQDTPNSIIFSDQQILIAADNLSRAEFVTTLRQRIDFIKDEGITNVFTIFTQVNPARAMTASEFISLTTQNAPQTLTEMLEDDFMLGVDGDRDFTTFIIFSLKNFDGTVDAMREWEPFFVQDMTRLIEIPTNGNLELFSKNFQSEILFNTEARVLRDENQGFVVGYVFLDRKTMAISTDIETLEEVIDRYAIQAIQ